MKIKRILFILALVCSLFLLIGCGDDYDTPEGLQLIGGGEDKGYYFFAPEEWTKGEEMNGISYVYASRVDTTSISFIEIDPATFVKPDPAKSDKDFFLEDYFNSTKAEFPDSTVFGEKNGEKCLLGSGDTKAEAAVKYTYNYLYADAYSGGDQRIAFMQILAAHNGRYYVFTYAATLTEKSDGVSTYDYYLEKLQSVIDNFRFTEITAESADKPKFSKDSDGDVLASDSELSGFTLYVPADFDVDYSSAIVSATHEDGSNITMTKATATGTTISNYWEFRKKELLLYADSVTDIGTNPHAIEFSNAKNAAVCEYTYEYNGKTFHVYQIFVVSGGLFQKGYIFTYTALEDNYSLHLDDINRILDKVKF